MSMVRWVAAQTVEYVIANLRLGINKPRGYDEAIKAFSEKHVQNSHALLTDYAIIQDSVKQMEIDGLLLAITKASRMGNVELLVENIEDASHRLALNSGASIKAVLRRLPPYEGSLFQQEQANGSRSDLGLAEIVRREWQVAIQLLWDERTERRDDPEIGRETISSTAIKHETGIGCAIQIVTDCFRVSKNTENGDYCANFSAERVYDNQSKHKGCILHFSWSGPVVSSPNIRPIEMNPGILHVQQNWRYILKPGTLQHLTLVGVSFTEEQIDEKLAPVICRILNSRGKRIAVRKARKCVFF